MSLESELKMLPREKILPENVLDLLKQNGYVIQGELKLKPQEDTYYDNSEQSLNKSGASFRIRRKNDGAVVTYKTPINSNEGFKQREEMEVEIPSTYIGEDGSMDVKDAISVLKSQFPNAFVPEGLDVAVTVKNNRNKVNVQTPEGTVIELAFDDLNITDAHGSNFKMKNEIESEILSGEPSELKNVRKIIGEKFDVQDNSLSKYSRAMKEMQEQKDNLSLEEVTTCAILSHIIDTQEFEKLKRKGQIIYDYRVEFPKQLELSNFKEPQYLMRRMSEVRRQKNYNPGKVENLEDMFLCYFSDMDYQQVENELKAFLNKNYYSDEAPATNRMLHSQQVMLVSGLIAKSKEIPEDEQHRLLCMTSGLVHDIGHVPGAHATERVLNQIDGFFSHEINGRNVIERIVEDKQESITQAIEEYYKSIGRSYSEEQIENSVQNIKDQIKKSIEAHSRTNSEKRGIGTVTQIPREVDKICYGISDIVDAIKLRKRNGLSPLEFFEEDWKQKTSNKLGSSFRSNEIRRKLETIENQIQKKNFGEIVTNIANTVRRREDNEAEKCYYEVEQDAWNVLNGTIKYVAGKREAGEINTNEDKMAKVSTLFAIKLFNQAMKECDGNKEEAWEKTLQEITRSNDVDLLKGVKDIIPKEAVEYVEQAGEISEEIKKRSGKMEDYFAEGEILDSTDIENLDNSNRQIKLIPGKKFEVTDLLPWLGSQWRIPRPVHIRDEYFENSRNETVYWREYEDEKRMDLIVKKPRNKDGVTQIEREKYVIKGDNQKSREAMMGELKEKYPDLYKSICYNPLTFKILTKRTNYFNDENATNKIAISKDEAYAVIPGINKPVDLPEIIEIECTDRTKLKEIRRSIADALKGMGIKLDDVATKETKRDMAMNIKQAHMAKKKQEDEKQNQTQLEIKRKQEDQEER